VWLIGRFDHVVGTWELGPPEVLTPWLACVFVLVDSESGPPEVLIPELIFGAVDSGVSHVPGFGIRTSGGPNLRACFQCL